MSKNVDLELRKAFMMLQVKMVETSKKLNEIDVQISKLKRTAMHIDITKREISTLPPATKTYESVGRMFLLTDLEDIKKNLNSREGQVSTRTTELQNNKQYLEKNLKDTEDNLREMVISAKNGPK